MARFMEEVALALPEASPLILSGRPNNDIFALRNTA